MALARTFNYHYKPPQKHSPDLGAQPTQNTMLTITDKTHDRILAKLDQFEHTLETLSDLLEAADESERPSLLHEIEKAQAKLKGATELFHVLNDMA